MSESMAVLGNFVELKDGIPKRMRFTDHRIVPRQLTDPYLRAPKTVNVLEFDVSEEDGAPVSKKYSVTSEKHAQQLATFLDGKLYTAKVFTITVHGKGFLREFTVKVE